MNGSAVSSNPDVLVVGGGPAGTSAAIRLARAGHAVTLLERRRGTWDRARGDLHVPSAVDELELLDLDDDPGSWHDLHGITVRHGERETDLTWPVGDARRARVWPRHSLEEALRSTAVAAGVDLRTGTEAVAPIVERGFVRGATIRVRADDARDDVDDQIRCRFLVVADGARSRFGRSLGTHRDRRWPSAVTAASYFAAERHDARRAEISLAPPDQEGRPVTGHAWVHPMGDGRVSVGVNVLSSYRHVLGVNVSRLLDDHVAETAQRWGFEPTAPLTEPARVRTPLGGSISPKMGPTFLVAGDAAGMANPFDGHGTGAALVTGRICAEVLDDAFAAGNSTALQAYPVRLAEALGEYQKVGRLAVRFLGRPTILGAALSLGMRSDTALGGALRIASGELRDERGGAERAFRLAALVARFAPSW